MRVSSIFSVLLILISFIPGSMTLPTPPPVAPSAVHKILLDTALEGKVCTAAAIAPNALLTAGHCDMGTDIVRVDGQNRHITTRLFDGKDHMILVVDGPPFTDVLPLTPRNALPHESVYMWGFPGSRTDPVYRVGYFEGVVKGMEIFCLPAFPGDSGSPVLDASGHIIAVVSMSDQEAESAALPLSFTPGQIAVALQHQGQ